MTNGERWKKVEKVLDKVLDAPLADRAELIETLCQDDPSLLEEVQELLAADAATQAQAFLDTLDEFAEIVDEVSPNAREKSRQVASAPLVNDQGRFVPGTLLADRYRVVALVGRGGMGEVYRADDLKLGLPVALKFLPGAESQNQRLVDRFFNEARVARSVSHPNISRIYDIGEHDDHHFLTMEYVDGENLTSLLRRIGRLPADKASQIARQMCAGLAAIHDEGLLHRDLKPANVMIDSRGTARITDFGLVGLASQIAGKEIRAGTPAYMAPEQLEGRAVSIQSDLYSLGLVLHELFTGERPEPKQPEEPATELDGRRRPRHSSRPQRNKTPLSQTSDSRRAHTFLPESVDQIIAQCLASDPRLRPKSALEIAAKLPGRDPIAEALAEGRTPEPRLLAVAGESGELRPSIGIALLVFFILGLTSIHLFPERMPLPQVPNLPKPPEVLKQRAQDLAAQLGYPSPRDSAYSFTHNLNFLSQTIRDRNLDLRKLWKSEQPSIAQFRYRQSPELLMDLVLARSPRDLSRFRDAKPRPPGMVGIGLWPNGNLRRLDVEPPKALPTGPTAPLVDWTPIIEAAGLDPAHLTVEAPTTVPPRMASRNLAWRAEALEEPRTYYEIRAAEWDGKPIYFEVIPHLYEIAPRRVQQRTTYPLFRLSRFLLLLSAVVFAQHNIRMGRGDRKGASRLATFGLIGMLLVWLISSKHSGPTEYQNFFLGFGTASVNFVLIWVSYLAVEPFMRRLWPHIMVSWIRLIDGQLTNPLVGRDILIGSAAGLASWFVSGQFKVLGETLWNLLPSTRFPLHVSVEAMANLGHHASELILAMMSGVRGGLQWIVLLLVLHHLLRYRWLAIAVFLPLTALLHASFDRPALFLVALIMAALTTVVLFRFGLLAMLYSNAIQVTLTKFQITLDPTVWWFDLSLLTLVVLLLPALFAFRISLGERSVVQEPQSIRY